MSRFFSDEAPCGNCGQLSRHVVASSVNAGRSPHLREEILSERFHRFECPFCREWFFADAPFAYIDVARRQWIVQHPTSWEPTWRSREAEVQRSFEEAIQGSGAAAIFAGARVRTVFGLAALREKIRCLDAGLDDAALEAFKIDRLRSSAELWFHPQGRPRLQEVCGDELQLLAPPPGGDPDHRVEIRIARGAVAEIAEAPGFEALLGELRSGSYVDAGRILFGGLDA